LEKKQKRAVQGKCRMPTSREGNRRSTLADMHASRHTRTARTWWSLGRDLVTKRPSLAAVRSRKDFWRGQLSELQRWATSSLDALESRPPHTHSRCTNLHAGSQPLHELACRFSAAASVLPAWQLFVRGGVCRFALSGGISQE